MKESFDQRKSRAVSALCKTQAPISMRGMEYPIKTEVIETDDSCTIHLWIIGVCGPITMTTIHMEKSDSAEIRKLYDYQIGMWSDIDYLIGCVDRHQKNLGLDIIKYQVLLKTLDK